MNQESTRNRHGARKVANDALPHLKVVEETTHSDARDLRLFDPRRGDVAFRLERLPRTSELSRPQRFNYFTVLQIHEGGGRVHADLSAHEFQGPCLQFFNPYQTFFVAAASPLSGVRLQFHANFFCIETHHEAVGCNGVLFNDVYGPPIVALGAAQSAEFDRLISRIEDELATSGLAQTEVLVSYLKVYLIQATRLKLAQQPVLANVSAAQNPPLLARLTDLIERHYQTWHSPADYAAELHMTPKALGRVVKSHFKRTLTALIRERLLKHAKWQLLHTTRPVKEIAWEIGFADELYFSRLFRRATGLSPTRFREFETAIRGGSNLSM